MTWVSDALFVLNTQWVALLRILAVFGVGSILTYGLLRRGLNDSLDTTEAFLLALVGWPFWWVICAFVAYFINPFFELGPGWAAFLLAICGIVLVSGWKNMPAPLGSPSWLLLSLFLVFLLFLFARLAFLANLIVPSYFDAALHYSIIQHMLNHFGVWPWQSSPTLVSGYYHLGFHQLAVISAFVAQTGVAETILIIGQLTLALMPFPIFLVVKRETDSTLAAFFVLVLAGWGWDMPAHALNWGKYPALSGLLSLQFALALVYLTTRSALDIRRKMTWGAFFLVGAVFAAFMHSRALVVIILVVTSYLAACVWMNWPRRVKWSVFAFSIAALGGLVIYLETRVVLNLVFDPYLRAGLWITLLVVALSPFALRRFERLAAASLFSMLLLLACLLLPLPGDLFQTPLDRPFVQMTLYLFLALLGGLGLAGLRRESFKTWLTALATVAVFSAVFIHIGRDYKFSPSPCCILLKQDDAVAFDWLDAHLPRDANILIAGNTLTVFDIENPAELRAADAGIWLPPLVDRQVLIEHFDLDFRSQETLNSLCQRGVTHIYVGGTQEHFNLDWLRARPEWYDWQFSLPGAHLFRLAGCP